MTKIEQIRKQKGLSRYGGAKLSGLDYVTQSTRSKKVEMYGWVLCGR